MSLFTINSCFSMEFNKSEEFSYILWTKIEVYGLPVPFENKYTENLNSFLQKLRSELTYFTPKTLKLVKNKVGVVLTKTAYHTIFQDLYVTSH